jgi:hypothetical protein
MLPDTAASKVTAAHLSRTALLYVRQSSLKQVIHNTESAIRQYDLRGKAISLGWAADQITVIDIDQGHSGASAADREGFQHLVAEVSLGRAGIVLGLECSRLARNSADWHQLLELCGMTSTLICDEDGLYDPRNFNEVGHRWHRSSCAAFSWLCSLFLVGFLFLLRRCPSGAVVVAGRACPAFA